MAPLARVDGRRLPTSNGERSIGELVRDLSDETTHLIRQEIRLAKTEVAETVRGAAAGAGWIAAGGAIAFAAVACLVVALIAGLATILGGRVWLAALIVAVAFGFGAYLLVRRGISRFGHMELTETTDSVRETVTWLKHPKTSDPTLP